MEDRKDYEIGKKLSGRKGTYAMSLPIEIIDWIKSKSRETGITQTRLGMDALKAMYGPQGMPTD